MSTLLADQLTRTSAHDPGVDLKVYVGLPRTQYEDMSRFYAGSNVYVGTGSNFVDVTSYVGGQLTLDSGEHGAKITLKANRYDHSIFGQDRVIVVKARFSAGGTDSVYNYPSKVLANLAPTNFWQLASGVDSGSGGNNFTFSGTAVSATNLVASGGGSRSFNGSSDYAASTTLTAYPTRFTVATWLQTSAAAGVLAELAQAAPPTGNWGASLAISSGLPYAYGFTGVGSTVQATVSVNDGQTHFVAAVFDDIARQMAIWVDGGSLAQGGSKVVTNYSGNLATFATPQWNLGVGKGSSGTVGYFNGLLGMPLVLPTPLGDAALYDLWRAGADDGYHDIFVGYIQDDRITAVWSSNLFDINAEGESVYMAKMLAPAHRFGASNLAQGKTTSASSVLLIPQAEWPLEHFTGGTCGPEKAVDGDSYGTLWIAQGAPSLAGDYYSTVFGTYYRLNEVFDHSAGPNDLAPAKYVEIIASGSANWNTAGTRNLGNIQTWDATYMPGGSPGMIGWHANGNNWSLATSSVALPFSPAPNNQQVLRSTASGNIKAHLLFIMTPGDNQSSDHTVTPIPGWNYRAKLWFRVQLPSDNNNHYVRIRHNGNSSYVYIKATGDWQLYDGNADAGTVNNAANSYWSLQLDPWTTSDRNGVLDTSIPYIDAGRLQVIAGAPILADYNVALNKGLGDLHLIVRDHSGATLQDIDLSRISTSTTKTQGLQSIVLTPSKAALQARFGDVQRSDGALVLDTNDLYPGVWFDSYAAGTTLSAAINATVTTIAVVSTVGFASSGTIVIDSGTGSIETIPYTSVDATHFIGCTRVGTISHLINAPVGQQTAVGSLELYSAAYTDTQHGSHTVARVTHDILTLDNAAQPANTAYGSYSNTYPTNSNYSYQRSPGIFGAWAQNIYPSPGTPTMGSIREVIMVDLGVFVPAQLGGDIGTTDTSFAVIGNSDHLPLNGIILVDSEYMLVTGYQGGIATVVRNVTLPSTPPQNGTLASHSNGVNLTPMLPDLPPATTWHQQTNNRVAAVVLARKNGMAPIVDCTVVYSTTTAAIPTQATNWEYATGWNIYRRVSANSSNTIVLLAPGNTMQPPSFPIDPNYFYNQQLVGLEAREIAVIINHMGIRPDGTGKGDRGKLQELIVDELPTNAHLGGGYSGHENIGNMVNLFGHLWAAHYGADISHPAAEMAARYRPSSTFNYIGGRFDNLTLTGSNTYAAAIQDWCNRAGLDWCVDEWGALNVYFHRHSGLGLAPGQTPVYDFNRSNSRQAQITREPQQNVAQVKLSGKDAAGRMYYAYYPTIASKVGKVDEVNNLVVFSQAALDRMAKARYYAQNRTWTVVLETGICEWLQRGQLVTLTWNFDETGISFTGAVFVVASWQMAFVQQSGIWQLRTIVKLEERRLL